MVETDTLRAEIQRRRNLIGEQRVAIEAAQAAIEQAKYDIRLHEEVITSLDALLKASGEDQPSTKPGSAPDLVLELLQDGKFRSNEEIRKDLGVGNEHSVVNKFRTATYHLAKRKVIVKREGKYGIE